DNIGETIEGLQRFPINVRYPREVRDSVEKIRTLPLLTERGAQIRLGDVSEVKVSDGPPMLKSENARLSGWVYVDIRGRDLSSAVGFIALAGVAAEIGVVMLVYVNQAVAAREAAGGLRDEGDFAQAIVEGAALRVRPVAMTVAVIIAGLLPIMFGSGTGSEVMRRIASPMVGGMITAPLLSMFVVPVAYLLLRRPRAAARAQT